MLIPDVFEQAPYCRPMKGIIHIGAHTCEEEPLYHSIGMHDDQILWIEGNRDLVHQQGKKNMVHAVISDTDDETVEFMITNNMQSSSILNLKLHLVEHPHVYEIARRTCQTITLNTLFDQHQISYDAYDFMNLDIQGAELKALKGATKILPHINAVYTEVNEKELYEGAVLLPELDDFLQTFGFVRVLTSMTQHGWGDALYVKK